MTILRVAEDLNKKELQSLEIAVLYSKIPESIKTEIISPYISVQKDEARIVVRVKDSMENLRRNDLINKINFELNSKLGLKQMNINYPEFLFCLIIYYRVYLNHKYLL